MSVDGQMLDSGGVAIMHKVVIARELWPTRLDVAGAVMSPKQSTKYPDCSTRNARAYTLTS